MNLRVTFDVEAAMELWKTDIPVSEMASRLQITKNALTGFAFRNRDLFPLKDPAQGTRRRHGNTGPRPPKVVVVKAPREPKPIPAKKIEKTSAEAYDASRVMFMKPLMELERGKCKFPLAEDRRGNFLFCAETTDELRPYCSHHVSRCCRPRISA